MFSTTAIENRLREMVNQPAHVKMSVRWTSACNDESYISATKVVGKRCLVLETGVSRGISQSIPATQRSCLKAYGWTSSRKRRLRRDIEIEDEASISDAANFIFKTMTEGYVLNPTALTEAVEINSLESDESRLSSQDEAPDVTESPRLLLGIVLIVCGVIAVLYGLVSFAEVMQIQQIAEHGNIFEKTALQLQYKYGGLEEATDLKMKIAAVSLIVGLIVIEFGWSDIRQAQRLSVEQVKREASRGTETSQTSKPARSSRRKKSVD
jgi:hypothetical protein